MRRTIIAATGAVVCLIAGSQGAVAQTVGNDGDGTGAGNLLNLTGRGGIVQPGNNMPVDFGASFYAYIANPYIGVFLGLTGGYSINYGTNFTIPYSSPGMISFGNLIGSSRIPGDDRQSLNSTGFGIGDVFPVPGSFEININGFLYYDYPAYLRARVDQTNVNIVQPTNFRFENSVLTGTADLGNNVALTEEFTLYRTQARIRWLIVNNDPAASHTVTLRFNVNQTGARFYLDPVRGRTNRFSILTGGDIPDTLAFYGSRYEDPTGAVYASRHTFRGAGATPPYKVAIANAFELRPSLTNFDVTDPDLNNSGGGTPITGTPTNLVRQPGIEAATASFFGPYTLTPGGRAEVITFYGNGTPSERLDNDFVTSLDGPEALTFNSTAANNPDVLGNMNATITQQGVEFLSPNPFQIFAGMYNRVPSNPSDKVDYTNVTASLSLPTGLGFATNPNTNAVDTSLKLLNNGRVLSDRGGDTSWYVRPTGEAFGTLTYAVAINTQELGGRQQTRSINIPAVPFRSVTNTSFQMIGFPFAFDPLQSNNGDPATVINTLTRPADEPVAFYQWVPDPTIAGNGSYQIATRLQNGIGYMYRPQLSRTFFAKGVLPESGQGDIGVTDISNLPQRQVILEAGWNMIANPYVYDSQLQFLRFAQPSATTTNGETIPDVASQTFNSAVNSGLVRAGVFNLNTTTRSYDAVTDLTAPLRPWEAYWIYVTSRTILIYPNPTQRQGVVLPGDGGDNPPTRVVKDKNGKVKTQTITKAVEPNTLDNWKLQLIAKRGDAIDKATWIGATNKNEAESRRVLPKPPTPLSSYVYVGLVKEAKGSRYAKDVRQGRGAQTWNLEVSSDEDGPVTVTWPNAAQMSRRLNLKVRDIATGRQYSMRSLSSFTLPVTRSQPARLEITSSTEASIPLMLSGVQIVRGTGGRSVGGREFVFRVSRDASVSGKILTMTGAPVATISTGRAVTRGEGRIQWDGKAQNGSPLPPGPYRLELEARDSDGNVAPVSHIFVSNE